MLGHENWSHDMEGSLFGVMTKFHSFGFLFPLLIVIPHHS